MAKIDFITLSNIIFKDKNKFKFVSDEEKEANFFIINRKFAFSYLKQAQFFNDKNINKPSAIDIWFQIFQRTTNGTPTWWWKTKANTKEKSKIPNADYKLIKNYYNLTDNDVNFLITYYEEKLKKDLKRIKKFKNE